MEPSKGQLGTCKQLHHHTGTKLHEYYGNGLCPDWQPPADAIGAQDYKQMVREIKANRGAEKPGRGDTPQWIRENKPQSVEVMARGIANDLLGSTAYLPTLQMLIARLAAWHEAIVGQTLAGASPSPEPPSADGIFWRDGDRWLREHGKEYKLLEIAPRAERRWIAEHPGASPEPPSDPAFPDTWMRSHNFTENAKCDEIPLEQILTEFMEDWGKTHGSSQKGAQPTPRTNEEFEELGSKLWHAIHPHPGDVYGADNFEEDRKTWLSEAQTQMVWGMIGRIVIADREAQRSVTQPGQGWTWMPELPQENGIYTTYCNSGKAVYSMWQQFRVGKGWSHPGHVEAWQPIAAPPAQPTPKTMEKQ